MELSRRGFLGGLLAVVSAPAIVRVESLMRLPAPQAIIRPSYENISMRMMHEYLPYNEEQIHTLDILYGYQHIRPEWVLPIDDFASKILTPMVNSLAGRVAESIMNEHSADAFQYSLLAAKDDIFRVRQIKSAEMLADARKATISGG